jgi:hypothetical protein
VERFRKLQTYGMPAAQRERAAEIKYKQGELRKALSKHARMQFAHNYLPTQEGVDPKK